MAVGMSIASPKDIAPLKDKMHDPTRNSARKHDTSPLAALLFVVFA